APTEPAKRPIRLEDPDEKRSPRSIVSLPSPSNLRCGRSAFRPALVVTSVGDRNQPVVQVRPAISRALPRRGESTALRAGAGGAVGEAMKKLGVFGAAVALALGVVATLPGEVDAKPTKKTEAAGPAKLERA